MGVFKNNLHQESMVSMKTKGIPLVEFKQLKYVSMKKRLSMCSIQEKIHIFQMMRSQNE